MFIVLFIYYTYSRPCPSNWIKPLSLPFKPLALGLPLSLLPIKPLPL